MSNNITVTGVTGFVGSNLVKYLFKKGLSISVIVRESSDLSGLEEYENKITFFRYNNNLNNLIEFFKEIEPICVFHLASNVIAEHNPSQIDSLVNSNISFGLHILEAMKEAGVNRLINTGTSWQHFNNEDYNPVCLYAATKQAFEALIEFYVKAEDFKVITLKLFDTYGESDTRPKLINLLNKFADEQTELNMSPGEQMLNLVHISDVCNAYYIAFNQVLGILNSVHNTYSISHKEEYQLKEVIEVFENVTGKKINVNWGGRPYREREVMDLWVKGINLPNWYAKIGLSEGLGRFKSN